MQQCRRWINQVLKRLLASLIVEITPYVQSSVTNVWVGELTVIKITCFAAVKNRWEFFVERFIKKQRHNRQYMCARWENATPVNKN